VNTEWMPLLQGNPDIDEVVEFPRSRFRGVTGLAEFAKWLRDLRNRMQPDVALDFQCLLRSALMGRASRAGEILGLSDAREGAGFFYDEVADVTNISHAVDRYFALAKLAGADVSGPPEFPLPEGTRPSGFEMEPKSYVVLHPFARGEGKSIGPALIREFCLAMQPAKVVLVGRSSELLNLPDNTLNLVNATSLGELIWLLRHASFTVSVDSGPMHLAAALGPNLLSIHTWSDPAKVGPYRAGAWIWKGGQIAQTDGTFSSGTDHLPDAESMRQMAVLVRKKV
jgi:heptosyltransferase I